MAESELPTQVGEGKISPDMMAQLKEKHGEHIVLALAEYDNVANLLAKRENSARLTAEEENYLRHALFAAPECQIRLGNYSQALYLYRCLADRYQHQVDSLHALAGVRRCYLFLSLQDPKNSNSTLHGATLNDIRKALTELDDTAFDKSVSGFTREQWEEWLKQESKKDVRHPLGPTGSTGSLKGSLNDSAFSV